MPSNVENLGEYSRDFTTNVEILSGPPGWNQLVNASWGDPYYVPHPYAIGAGIWLLCCVGTIIWLVLTNRKSHNNPITRSLSGWRYRLAMTLAIFAFLWALFDDTYRMINDRVEHKLFLAQLIFDFVWDSATIALLLSIYDLFFHLMREVPFGNGKISRGHFWRYKMVKSLFCSLLVLLSFLMMCLRIAYLTGSVFHPPSTTDKTYLQYDKLDSAATIMCYMFVTLFFLASFEVLVVASVLLSQRKHKNGSGSTAVYIYNLLLVALPFFLTATFALINTCIRPPRDQIIGKSFGPSDSTMASLAVVQFTAFLLNGIGVVLPFGGIVKVAKGADASIDRIGRLTPDSLDMVLVGQDSERIPAHIRPPSSNYDDPGSWGGSTAA